MSGSTTKVLVVDDEPEVCWLIENVLSREDVSCTSVHTGSEAKDRLISDEYDVAIIDLVLPGIRGIEVLQFMSDRRLPTRALCIGGAADAMCRSEVMAAGAIGFLAKPLDMAEVTDAVLRAAAEKPRWSRPRGAVENSIALNDHWQGDERLRQMVLECCRALVHSVEAKDPYTRRHTEHVAFYAEQLARHIGLSESVTETIRVAALVHDTGKIAIPDAILTKPGRLTEPEFELVRQHSDVGAAILGNISVLKDEATLVRFHHENWDGTGYPMGLSKETIPLGARVIHLADSIDAMLMQRTYKQPLSVDEMLEELQTCAGTQFDPELAASARDWCSKHRDRLILPVSTTAEVA